MLAFVEEHFQVIVVVTIVLLVILFGLCLAAKLVKVAIGIFALLVIMPVIFTIFWGDGRAYVSQFAGLLAPEHQTQLETAYEYYKAKDEADPFVDYDAVSDTVTNVFEDIWENRQQLAEDAAQTLSDLIVPDSP